jgi:hypothetical protein
MTNRSTKEQLPTREKLDREARRLARSRHLTLVRQEPVQLPSAAAPPFHNPDPDPKAAA